MPTNNSSLEPAKAPHGGDADEMWKARIVALLPSRLACGERR